MTADRKRFVTAAVLATGVCTRKLTDVRTRAQGSTMRSRLRRFLSKTIFLRLHCQAPLEVTAMLKGGASWASGEFWSARRRKLPSRA
jgi:hypothetical protein